MQAMMSTRQDSPPTETLTQHVNLNYFSEAVSSEVKARLANADSWRITGYSEVKARIVSQHAANVLANVSFKGRLGF